jgi:ABC-type multidrug transport system fused ATPase/permease subunit
LKHIVTSILNILNQNEKAKLIKLILADLLIGLLDIAFLGLLLVVINFYTKNTAPSNLSFLPHALVNQNSLLLIGVFFTLFALKNAFGYFISKSQHHFFYDVSSRLSKRNIQNFLKDDYLRFVNIDSSVLIRKISQQPIEFSNQVLTNVQQIISQSILIFFTVVGILFWRPTLFFVLFFLLLPPIILLSIFIRKKLRAVRASTKTANL